MNANIQAFQYFAIESNSTAGNETRIEKTLEILAQVDRGVGILLCVLSIIGSVFVFISMVAKMIKESKRYRKAVQTDTHFVSEQRKRNRSISSMMRAQEEQHQQKQQEEEQQQNDGSGEYEPQDMDETLLSTRKRSGTNLVIPTKKFTFGESVSDLDEDDAIEEAEKEEKAAEEEEAAAAERASQNRAKKKKTVVFVPTVLFPQAGSRKVSGQRPSAMDHSLRTPLSLQRVAFIRRSVLNLCIADFVLSAGYLALILYSLVIHFVDPSGGLEGQQAFVVLSDSIVMIFDIGYVASGMASVLISLALWVSTRKPRQDDNTESIARKLFAFEIVFYIITWAFSLLNAFVWVIPDIFVDTDSTAYRVVDISFCFYHAILGILLFCIAVVMRVLIWANIRKSSFVGREKEGQIMIRLANYLIPFFICISMMTIYWFYTGIKEIRDASPDSIFRETIVERILDYGVRFFIPTQGLFNAIVYSFNSSKLQKWFSQQKHSIKSKMLIKKKKGSRGNPINADETDESVEETSTRYLRM